MSVALKIKHIVKEHSGEIKNSEIERWLARVLEDLALLIEEEQQSQEERLATKEDIKLLMQMMDKRFEAMEKSNTARFEAMDKRFEAMEKANAERFEYLKRELEITRATMDKRFEAMEKSNAARFEAIHHRFESIEKRLGFITWFIPIVLSIIMGLFAYVIKHG